MSNWWCSKVQIYVIHADLSFSADTLIVPRCAQAIARLPGNVLLAFDF